MSNDFGPDGTLSPDEATTWRAIEQSLAGKMSVERLQRRARLRSDRLLAAAGAGAGISLLVSLMALTCPAVLVTLGLMSGGACLTLAAIRMADAVRPTADAAPDDFPTRPHR